MSQRPALAAFDIETTGLDPSSARVRAIAVATTAWTRVFLGDDEASLIEELDETIGELPSDAVLVSWNGEEFDLPFLLVRASAAAVDIRLTLVPSGEVGKYGRPTFRASWANRRHVDISGHYKAEAATLGVPWNLKPVARAVLNFEPIEVDRTGEAIAALSDPQLAAYVTSDTQVTLALASRLGIRRLAASVAHGF